MRSMSVVVAVAAVLWARSAEPCPGLPCAAEPTFHPRPGEAIPGNVPVLIVQTVSDGFTQPGTDAGVVLRADDGGIVPSTVELSSSGFSVRPTRALEAGQYHELTAPTLCARNADAGFFTARFFVTEPKPFPTTSGTLTVTGGDTREFQVPTQSGSCTEPQRAVSVTFEFEPSAELQSFLPVTSFSLDVPGKSLVTTSVGAIAAGERGRMTVISTCDRTPQFASTGPEPGVYTVVLVATIAGHPEPLRSEPVSIELACDRSPDPNDGCGCSGSAGLSAIALLMGLRLIARRRTLSA